MSGGIPSEVVGVSIGVLLYSVVCFFLCSMLVGLLITYGEKFSYVTINAAFTSLSCMASIIQQLYYAAQWEFIKQSQFEKAVRTLTLPGLTLTGGSTPAEGTLFFIQFWCYNIMSLNIFFWSVDLFTSAWGLRTPWLGEWLLRIGPMSKVFSIVFPSIIVGLLHADFILKSISVTFLVANGTMIITLPAGGILLILILYKYMKTRRLATGGSRRGGWWASRDSKSQQSRDVGSHYTMSTANMTTRTSIYDRALVTRFSIGFVILALFLLAIIVFSYFATKSAANLLTAGEPNHSVKAAIADVLLFMPGVTAALSTFLVFGTAKPWQQYRDLLIGGCGIRSKFLQRSFVRQRDEEDLGGGPGIQFSSLPSLQMTPSVQERARNEETKKRVQMFAKEVRRPESVRSEFTIADDLHRPNTAATLVAHAHPPVAFVGTPLDAQMPGERKNSMAHSQRTAHSRGSSVPPLDAQMPGDRKSSVSHSQRTAHSRGSSNPPLDFQIPGDRKISVSHSQRLRGSSNPPPVVRGRAVQVHHQPNHQPSPSSSSTLRGTRSREHSVSHVATIAGPSRTPSVSQGASGAGRSVWDDKVIVSKFSTQVQGGR